MHASSVVQSHDAVTCFAHVIPIFDSILACALCCDVRAQVMVAGTECGIQLTEFEEFTEGDLIECYIDTK